MNSFIRRASFIAGTTTLALVFGAGAASAHVSVYAPGAEQGGYSVLTFRVPTESDTAATSSVKVELPGLSSARTQPIPGWTSTVDKNAEGLATAVTWTAAPGAEVLPGQFQQFLLSAGPLPEQDSVSFPATQTYNDGEVVEWNEEPAADGSEPEKPAPTLTLTAASAESDGHGSATVTAEAEAPSAAESDNTARWMAGVALVLGALGAALGIGAAVRGRRS
ncbi:nuclear export factor GLE1 [Rhodococcus sp. EPR-157]|uniref:YcnI family copper-binding membrane protein n=1 Tax=Rhodococcus sp. EPR-157 TaxID=1813677 RepID=UPI0007BB3FBE|nr:YcnI family protein [Rhodococcus sp. EPR-157]KZF04050.1 nuclear export factor GLE1 [Rhodococcus sp. EPR-157]